MFLSLDGVDAAGKSTQIGRLTQRLEDCGHQVLSCRDPGTTKLGERIRGILLNHDNVEIDMRAEMLLYMAARAQLVAEVIRPAISQGKVVVSDRFLLANVVYQGHAGGLSPDEIWQVGRVATAGLIPDLTIVLDLDPAIAATRGNEQPDRMESRGQSFQRAVREGFHREAAKHASIICVDADQPPRQVADAIWACVQTRLPPTG